MREFLVPGPPWWADLQRVYGVGRDECLRLGTRARGRRPWGRTLEELWADGPRTSPSEIAQFYADVGPWFVYRQVVRHRFTCFGFIARRLTPGMCLLEFGAGVCPVSWWLLQHGPAHLRVTPVDVPSEHFRFGLDRLRMALPGHRWQMEVWPAWCYGGQLPTLPAGYFDIVTCLEVFEHLPDPVGTARALVNTLKLGGWLFEDFSLSETAAFSDLPQAQIARPIVYDFLSQACEFVEGKHWNTTDGGGTRIWKRK